MSRNVAGLVLRGLWRDRLNYIRAKQIAISHVCAAVGKHVALQQKILLGQSHLGKGKAQLEEINSEGGHV